MTDAICPWCRVPLSAHSVVAALGCHFMLQSFPDRDKFGPLPEKNDD